MKASISRVPISLKIFLTALAVADDLGAILVIALFYGEEVNLLLLASNPKRLSARLPANRHANHGLPDSTGLGRSI